MSQPNQPLQPGEQPEPPPPSPQPPDGGTVAATQAVRQVVLVKSSQRYVFRYAPGEEAQVLAGLIDMVRDPHNDLDWFDAAILCHQMGQRLGRQLEQMVRV